MSAPFSFNRTTQCNVYLGGNNLIGKIEEIEVGPVTFKQAEHKAVGMVGTVEFYTGIDKVEVKLKWTSFYNDVLKAVGNPMNITPLMVRSSVSVINASGLQAEYPLVIYCNVSPKNYPFGSFKQHENVDLQQTFSCYYVKIEENGEALFEFDALANVLKVGGVDILSTYRSNLGI